METDQFLQLQNQIESMTWIIGILTVIGLGLSTYLNSRMKELGVIKQKVESLSDLKKIESTITEAVKKVEHGFWNKQRLIDIKRDALERAYASVIEDINMHHSAWHDLSAGNFKGYYVTKSLYSALAHLYFQDVTDSTLAYNNHANRFSTLILKLQKNGIKNNLLTESELKEIESEFRILSEAAANILAELVKVAESLNREKDSNAD